MKIVNCDHWLCVLSKISARSISYCVWDKGKFKCFSIFVNFNYFENFKIFEHYWFFKIFKIVNCDHWLCVLSKISIRFALSSTVSETSDIFENFELWSLTMCVIQNFRPLRSISNCFWDKGEFNFFKFSVNFGNFDHREWVWPKQIDREIFRRFALSQTVS